MMIRWPWTTYTSVGPTASRRTTPGRWAGRKVHRTSPALRNVFGLASAWTAMTSPDWSWTNTWSSIGWTVAMASDRFSTGKYSRQLVTRLSRARSSAAGSRARVMTWGGAWAAATAASRPAVRGASRNDMMQDPPGTGPERGRGWG